MPDPIVLAPKGVDTSGVMAGAEAVNWNRLAGLPPFQVYVSETVRNDPELSGVTDSLAQAHKFLDRMFKQGWQAWLLEDYSAWHSDQGKWPDRTPMGEPR